MTRLGGLGAVGAWAGVRTSAFLVEPDAPALTTIAGPVDSGEVRVEVERTFTVEQAAEAHRLGETNRVRGKLVLDVTS